MNHSRRNIVKRWNTNTIHRRDSARNCTKVSRNFGPLRAVRAECLVPCSRKQPAVSHGTGEHTGCIGMYHMGPGVRANPKCLCPKKLDANTFDKGCVEGSEFCFFLNLHCAEINILKSFVIQFCRLQLLQFEKHPTLGFQFKKLRIVNVRELKPGEPKQSGPNVIVYTPQDFLCVNPL